MKEKFDVSLIFLFSFISRAYANYHAAYYVTTLTNDDQDTVKYNNISINTRFIKLARISGLSQVISTVLSTPSQKRAAGNKEEVLHLSQFMEKRKDIFKELYWNRKLTSTDITECSQVFLL